MPRDGSSTLNRRWTGRHRSGPLSGPLTWPKMGWEAATWVLSRRRLLGGGFKVRIERPLLRPCQNESWHVSCDRSSSPRFGDNVWWWRHGWSAGIWQERGGGEDFPVAPPENDSFMLMGRFHWDLIAFRIVVKVKTVRVHQFLREKKMAHESQLNSSMSSRRKYVLPILFDSNFWYFVWWKTIKFARH